MHVGPALLLPCLFCVPSLANTGRYFTGSTRWYPASWKRRHLCLVDIRTKVGKNGSTVEPGRLVEREPREAHTVQPERQPTVRRGQIYWADYHYQSW